MSFALDVKNEVSTLSYTNMEALVLLSAFVRNDYLLEDEKLKLQVENPKIVRLLFSLFRSLFDVSPEILPVGKSTFHSRTIFQLTIDEKISEILEKLMVFDEKGLYLYKLPSYFVDSEDLVRAYLTGAFLATGSINDPKTSNYHLEFLLKNESEAVFILQLLEQLYIFAKIIRRDKGYMVYVKESEKIGDFLRAMGCSRAVLYYEDIRIYRDHKNMTNRLNNCEQANVDKTILASEKQLNDISCLEANISTDLLDEKLKEVVIYRKKYPDLSLEELARVISYETGKPLTKSGLNHRFRKIKDMTDRFRKEKDN